jgi:hypothetical protein
MLNNYTKNVFDDAIPMHYSFPALLSGWGPTRLRNERQPATSLDVIHANEVERKWHSKLVLKTSPIPLPS